MPLDIHLPLDGAAAEAAEGANDALRKRIGDGIELRVTAKPHITLYLTDWIDFDESSITSTVWEAVVKFTPCEVKLTNPYAAGTYAMWNVTVSPCLQRYSDLIVNYTHWMATPDQPVPDWVAGLPPAERAAKAAMVKRYGSPNVFSQFQAHVSLGWGTDATAVRAAVAALQLEPHSFEPRSVAIGSVGAHGTVLRGKDVGEVPLSSEELV